MDALHFLRFWRHATMTNTSTTVPHLVVERDTESDEEDSFFDLELTVNDYIENKENGNISNKNDTNPSKMAKRVDDSETDISKTEFSLSPNEPISKRKVLPIEPISKPQSPIAILKSAPSFRISMFRRPKKMAPQKTEEIVKTVCEQKKKETRLFAVKLKIEEEPHSPPTLSRVNSSRSHGSKLRNQVSEETKSERFSKDLLRKSLKLIKPLYAKESKRYNDKMKFSDEFPFSASPMSSSSVASVSYRKEKQGSFPVKTRTVPKHLRKSRSASAATGVASSAKRSDDTLLQQHDGIQSAILHCKRCFNSRDSSIALSAEGSMHSLRNSFECETGTEM